jgi:hypothetical protein
MTIMGIESKGIESEIRRRAKIAELKRLLAPGLGQHCPRDCPKQSGPDLSEPGPSGAASRLGRSLDIREVAVLIGCSPWSIRHTWIPKKGLPHFRSSASGRLHFYEAQVVRWIERQQQGG